MRVDVNAETVFDQGVDVHVVDIEVGGAGWRVVGEDRVRRANCARDGGDPKGQCCKDWEHLAVGSQWQGAVLRAVYRESEQKRIVEVE